jgi:hypothetical protein
MLEPVAEAVKHSLALHARPASAAEAAGGMLGRLPAGAGGRSEDHP